MGYTKTDNTDGIFRIVPYGINTFYKNITEEGYLPIKKNVEGLTLSPTVQTNEAAYITKRKIESTYYRTKTYVSAKGFAILGIGSSTDNSSWEQFAYLAVGKNAEGLVYASISGCKVVTETFGVAPEATKATKDGDGKTITSTYLKVNDASSTYLTKTDAGNIYLKLTGGTLSGGIAIKKIVNNIETTTSLTSDTYTETKYITTYLSNNPSASALASGILINELGLYYRIEKEINSGTYTYYKCLHSGNYSTYALPLSGGTLTGNLTLSKNSTGVVLQGANTAISMTDVDGTTYKVLYNVKNSNKNVQLNSTGGEIFIGWANTTGIRLGYTTNCPIRLGTGAYGKTLPSTGSEGQIFFKLES